MINSDTADVDNPGYGPGRFHEDTAPQRAAEATRVRREVRVDLVSLASGAAIAALGALVLLDSAGALDLSLGWIAVALTGGARRDPARERARRAAAAGVTIE